MARNTINSFTQKLIDAVKAKEAYITVRSPHAKRPMTQVCIVYKGKSYTRHVPNNLLD